jgi:hypothetical protein
VWGIGFRVPISLIRETGLCRTPISRTILVRLKDSASKGNSMMPQKKFIIIREKVAHITKAPSMTTLPIRIDLTTENLNYQVHNRLN